jgi:hypothetical protein
MKAAVRDKLDALVKNITAESACTFVKERMFIDGDDIPCLTWSRLNQFIVFISDTFDARGIRQWRKAGREINEGAEPIHIFVPLFYKKGEEKDKDNSGKRPNSSGGLSGFTMIPVYRVEDTSGKKLDYEIRIKNFNIDKLPLINVAKGMGIDVKAIPTDKYYGAYDHRKKNIIMAGDNPQTFLHELSHAIDNALPNHSNDYDQNEIVAELSSAFLGSLYGAPVDIESTKSYISGYAGRGHVVFKVMKALDRVKDIYKFIEGFDAKKKAPKLKGVMPRQNRLLYKI